VYQFRDITADADDTFLPAEAVNFNGVQLDTAVPYFRTLQVTGRELIASDIDSYEVGNNIGEYFRSRKVGTREIEVVFQVKAPSNELYRETFNKLNLYLQAEEAKLIFNDEPDKYFIASSSDVSEPDAGCNCGTGKIRFTCSDPRKYSTTIKTFAAESVNGILTANVVNNGNVPVPIDYEITMSGDNGYIGIVSDHGAMQYGFVDEEDGHEYTRSERLMTIDTVYNAANDASTVPCIIQPDFAVSGTLGKTSQIEGRQWLYANNVGTGNVWHGGQKTIEIPADSNGVKGCKSFSLYMRNWFENASLNELGYQSVSMLDADGKVLCGIQIFKSGVGSSKAYYNLIGNGKLLKQYTFNADAFQNNCFRADNGNNCIWKRNDQLIFYFFGYRPFAVPEIAESEAVKVQISIGAFGTYAGMTRNYIGAFDFDKLNVEKYSNDPNRYSAGDVLTIDGSKGRVYVNGLSSMDEITGTVYFPANTGNNQIEFYKSTWANDITAKATIREAWL
jgi:predicted phage tail component-like protein